MLSSERVNIQVKYVPSYDNFWGTGIFPCKKCVEHKDGIYIYQTNGKQIAKEQYENKLLVLTTKDSITAINSFEVKAPKADIYAVKNPALEVSSKANLEVGLYYPLLQVARAQDMKLVGADIVCQILERRKSNLTGAEGVLRFRPICIRLTDGTEIQLVHDDIFLRGRNRSNVKWWLFPFFPVAGEGTMLDPYMEFPLYFK